MSGPFGSSQWMYSSGGFYEFPIEQSLKFNDNDSSHLIRTPASAGNQRTWTWSCWFKRGSLGSFQNLIGTAYVTSGNYGGYITLEDTDKLRVYSNLSGTVQAHVTTNMVFRDVSAWYHVVVAFDSTEASAGDRIKIYVNGSLVTYTTTTAPSLNVQGQLNDGERHDIGSFYANGSNTWYFDGYLAEVNFIDGQALDPTSFGEFKSGVWIPKDPSGLTYGTNGFRLSFQNDTVSEGFNTVTYTGNGATQSINGIGFEPDLIWGKSRNNTFSHALHDSVRGFGNRLVSNDTGAESFRTDSINSVYNGGFTLGSQGDLNYSGNTMVAWCWDAGSGSPVSNTSGSITSTVKANAAYGMSIISYTATGTAGTIGHGLNSAPEMIIVKHRDQALTTWPTYHSSIGANNYLRLNATNASATDANAWNNTAPTASVFSVGNNGGDTNNTSGGATIAYAFHSVAGYSKVGSYSGSGATGNAITTGFKPAFVMIKRSDNVGSWVIWDNTRDTTNPNQYPLYPNLTNTESFEPTDRNIQFDSNGFTLLDGNNDHNASGGTYIYIAFADTRDNAFWLDQSGNGNDWQPNNLTYQDGFPDAPTNNFCTFNSAIRPYPSTDVLSEGNLRRTNTFTGVTGSNWGTFNVTSGKWYYEVAIETSGALTCWVGWSNNEIFAAGGTYASAARDHAYMYMSNGNKALDSATGTSYGATYNTGDVIGIALDADNSTLTFYKNGVSQGVAFTGISTVGSWIPAVSSDPGWIPVANFGQDSSFAGIKPAQGNTDDNGIGDFYYAPPSGYLALCTANLPDPVIDPAKDDVPSDYFNTVTWTGTGTTLQIPLDFTADFVWAKRRNGADSHVLYDFIRGENVQLTSNSTAGDTTNDYGLDFLGHDYLEVDGTKYFGGGGGGSPTFVAWNWLAGNGTSSNTSGSITSTVSVNQKAGFSVVSYTGTGAVATFGHGIGSAPSMVIIKDRDNGTKNWTCYHKSMGNDRSIFLNLTDAQTASTDHWQYTDPSSSVVYIGDYSHINTSGNNYIAYCFAEVEGFSRFGSFVGNGSTDGPFVYTGFKPAWLLMKYSSTTSYWIVLDNKRNVYNLTNNGLQPNTSAVENSNLFFVDFLSNGFKARDGGGLNGSGQTTIYMAFAESPFKYSNAR